MELPGPRAAGDRYELLQPIGEGAMGIVYQVRDRETGQILALKTLRQPSAEDLFRLKREFRALSGIIDPNLVELHDLEVEGERGWFTMEWVDGLDLVSSLRGPEASGRNRAERIRDAFGQLASGLSVLHANQKLHRDIKPANVLMESGGRVVILDFGLVAVLDDGPAAATRGWIVGTLAYMAPELARGVPASAASDWYSVGAVLYEVLTARLPFDPSRMAVRKASDRPVHPRELEPEAPRLLADLAMDLLVGDPDQRPDETQIRARLESPRSTASTVSPSSPLVGRDPELAVLREAFDDSRHGAVSIRVEGSSGIGKSALVSHFASKLSTAGEALVLCSRCHPQERVRYAAVDGIVDELSRYLIDQPADRLDTIAPRHRAALIQVFPVLGRVPFPRVLTQQSVAGVDPLETRRRAFSALSELLGRLSERLPLVLWIDDVQWGDLDSAGLLRELLHGVDAPPALTILSYRAEDRDESPLILQLLEDEAEQEARHARSLRLAPLDAAAAGSLIAGLVEGAGELVESAAQRLLDRAGGSPFVLGELVRSLTERVRAGARGTSLSELRMHDVVRDRTDRLSAEARGLLEIVAVSGVPLARSVALSAAGLSEGGRRTAGLLRQDFLLRSSPVGQREGLEVYHDRIRESVLASIPADRLTSLHRSLLAEFESEPDVAPERLYRHAFAAGEGDRAAGYARTAGDQSAEALAFELAADYYARSLEAGSFSADSTREILRRRADALVNAGRCEEAAPLYLEVAEGGPVVDSREVRRLAAEQYMVSGLAREGLDVLRPLLAELGLHYPPTPTAALASTVVRLLQLRLRGIRYRDLAEDSLAAFDRARIDVCFSAARGLVMTDTVRAAYLPLVGLLLALRAGEPRRVGRNLAMVAGAVLAPFGGSLGRFRDQLLGESHAIAERTSDPYVAASVALAEGQIGILDGDWRRAVKRSEEAIAILRDQCQGVSWERNVGHAGELRGLEELGDFEEGHVRALRMAAEAEEHGDRYGALVAALMLGITWTARERTDEARRQLRDALARWPSDPYQMQHFYALRVEVHADLCDGDAESAQRRLDEAWPRVRRSGFLRVAAPRIDALLMRARVAGRRRESDSEAERTHLACIRALAKEKREDARAHAALMSAWRRGAAAGAGELERAASSFDAAGMAFFAGLARSELPQVPEGDGDTAIGWQRAVAPQANSRNSGSA